MIAFQNHLLPIVKPADKSAKDSEYQLNAIKTKLRKYVADNDTPEARRLLECHAHCFIVLS